MDEDKLENLQGKVETSLGKQIRDLETITRDLESDIKTSVGSERDKNVALLKAAAGLLEELKQAQININQLLDKSKRLGNP